MTKLETFVLLKRAERIYSIKHSLAMDYPHIKYDIIKHFDREDNFNLDIAILGDTEFSFWQKQWDKVFAYMSYNTLYNVTSERRGPIAKSLSQYTKNNIVAIKGAFSDIHGWEHEYYNERTNDYFTIIKDYVKYA